MSAGGRAGHWHTRRWPHAPRRSAAAVRAALLAMMVLLATVAGCSGLPSDGPVIVGEDIGDPGAAPPRVIPEPVAVGAEPKEVVRGMLRAMAGYDPERTVTKTFVADPGARDWEQSQPVTVLDGEAPVVETWTDPTTVRLSGRAIGTIDNRGRWSSAAAGTSVSTTWRLVSVSGQWRIDLPATDFTLWVPDRSLRGVYSPQPLHYVTLTGRRLVQDWRWFALGPRLATTLTLAQLEPVPDYLRGAVTTGAPLGAALVVTAVPVQGRSAGVDLRAGALSPDVEARKALWAQLAATLTRMPEVSKVQLLMEGRPLDIEGVGPDVGSPEVLGYSLAPNPSPTAVLVRAGATVTALPDPPVGSVPTRDLPLGWIDPALSADGATLAVVSASRREIAWYRQASLRRVPAFGEQLLRPSFDEEGFALVAGTRPDGAGGVWALTLPAGAEPARTVTLEAGWLSSRVATTLKVSPDGSRALIVSHERRDGARGGDRIDLAGIVRSANGEPVSLAAPLAVIAGYDAVPDAVWVDNATVGLLVRGPGEDTARPLLLGLGRPADELTRPPARPTGIDCLGSTRSLTVSTEAGAVYRRAGTGWTMLAPGSDLLVAGR